MGHLINPISVRFGINLGWNSNWTCNFNKIYIKVWSMDFILNRILNNFLSQPKLWRLGIFFSHYKFYRLLNKIFIKIFIYDGRMFEFQNLINNNLKYKFNRKNKFFWKKKFWGKFIKIVKKRKDFFQLNQKLFLKKFLSNNFKNNFKFVLKKFYFKNFYNEIFFKNIKKTKKNMIGFFIRDYIVLEKKYKNIFVYFLFLLVIWELFFSIKKIFNNLKFEFSFYFLTNSRLTAKGIAHFICIKLKQRMKVNLILKWVRQILIKYTYLAGFKFQLSGRFTRKQRKSKIIWIYGPLSLNNFSKKIDYAADWVRLKYSTCGVKIWLHYFNKKICLKQNNNYFFKI